MNVIYEKFKQAILERELKTMERMPNEKLEEIVEEAKHSMGVAGEVAERASASTEKFREAIRKTPLGIDISHHNPTPGLEVDGDDVSWTSLGPIGPPIKDSTWIALYTEPPLATNKLPRFKFAASPQDFDLDIEDFGYDDIMKFADAHGLTRHWLGAADPLERYIRCPLTNQQMPMSLLEQKGVLPLLPESRAKMEATSPSSF